MILSKSKIDKFGASIDRSTYSKICKKIQDSGDLKFAISSQNELSVATATFCNNCGKKYVLNICRNNNRRVSAILIDMDNLNVRYSVDLQTHKVDANGEVIKCTDEDMNLFINDFVNEVLTVCI